MPEISVIVPIYNTEKYLARCIDSILLQTYTDFELILVNDGSTDQSGMICEDYAKKDSRVRVFHQKNQGQAAARNFALDWIDQNSSSTWISFVDSDDWIHPQMLEYLYGIAYNNKTKIGICGYSQTVGDMPKIEQEQLCTKFYDVESFYCENADVWAVVPWGKIYHRDCFKGIRYPLVRACEDEFVTYKILFQFSTLPVMEAPLYYYFMSENSTMRSVWTPKRLAGIKALRERMQFFKKTQYQRAWSLSVKIYLLWGLYGQMTQIEELPNAADYKFIQKKLLYKLKIDFLRYRRKEKFDMQTYLYVYEKIYPKFMRFYWLIQGQIHKVMKSKIDK